VLDIVGTRGSARRSIVTLKPSSNPLLAACPVAAARPYLAIIMLQCLIDLSRQFLLIRRCKHSPSVAV
jgi:hypothetical protein